MERRHGECLEKKPSGHRRLTTSSWRAKPPSKQWLSVSCRRTIVRCSVAALLVLRTIIKITTIPLTPTISPKNDTTQFEFLSPSAIDFSIDPHLFQNDDNCTDVILFLPYIFASAGNGHGSQINSYLLATVVATFLDKPMVILEPPRELSKFGGGSQFGCPADAFENRTGGGDNMLEGFPDGLNRLIRYPRWISRGCEVPFCSVMGHIDSKIERYSKFSSARTQNIACQTEMGEVKVMALGGTELRTIFYQEIRSKMLDRSSPVYSPESARLWAMRLGANPQEATAFSRLTVDTEIWDFLAGLISRSDILRFQPWIGRDVAAYIRESNLPVDVSYDAIHLRRGDKLIFEAREEVKKFWTSRGYQRENAFPTNYIPLEHYIQMGWGSGGACEEINTHRMARNEERLVYIATDDPQTVKEEVQALLNLNPGEETVAHGCQRLRFIFSPAAQNNSTIFHLNAVINDGCADRYRLNIWAIADLILLTKSKRFVGEYNSNWGRLVRTFRVDLNSLSNVDVRTNKSSTRESPVLVRDSVVAFGSNHPGHIGE